MKLSWYSPKLSHIIPTVDREDWCNWCCAEKLPRCLQSILLLSDCGQRANGLHAQLERFDLIYLLWVDTNFGLKLSHLIFTATEQASITQAKKWQEIQGILCTGCRRSQATHMVVIHECTQYPYQCTLGIVYVPWILHTYTHIYLTVELLAFSKVNHTTDWTCTDWKKPAPAVLLESRSVLTKHHWYAQTFF